MQELTKEVLASLTPEGREIAENTNATHIEIHDSDSYTLYHFYQTLDKYYRAGGWISQRARQKIQETWEIWERNEKMK